MFMYPYRLTCLSCHAGTGHDSGLCEVSIAQGFDGPGGSEVCLRVYLFLCFLVSGVRLKRHMLSP